MSTSNRPKRSKKQIVASREKISEEWGKLLNTGRSPSDAAKEISAAYPANYADVMWIAGDIARRNECTNRVMRSGGDLYQNVVLACGKKLQEAGYQVYTEPDDISRCLRCLEELDIRMFLQSGKFLQRRTICSLSR